MMPPACFQRERGRARTVKPRRRRAGTTMVEVMLVFGLMTVLTTGLFSLLLSSLNAYDNGSSKGISDTAASLALQKVTREIADGMSATVSSGQLTVQLPLVNDQGNYDHSTAGNTVKLYVSSNKLYKQINSGTVTVLQSDVTSASFTVATGSVTVTITAQGQNGKNTLTTQMSQVVALRNYEAP